MVNFAKDLEILRRRVQNEVVGQSRGGSHFGIYYLLCSLKENKWEKGGKARCQI